MKITHNKHHTTAPKIFTENAKSFIKTNTIKEKLYRSPICLLIPKIENSRKTHKTNSKPNTKQKMKTLNPF